MGVLVARDRFYGRIAGQDHFEVPRLARISPLEGFVLRLVGCSTIVTVPEVGSSEPLQL